MTFPTINDAIKALVIAIVLAVAGFFLFPLTALDDPRESLVIALALGAFIGILLHRLRLPTRDVSSGADGETSTLFVGNLAFKASQDELSALFAPFTSVHSIRIMKDRATRRPRGFAFVEIDSKHSAKAIKKLDGLDFHGRKLRVNVSNKAAQSNE